MSNNVRLSTTASNNRASFLDLPAEVRNEIYNVILTQHEQVYITSCHSTGTYKPRTTQRDNGDRTIDKTRLSASLLQVCPQVSDEATPILYGENRFHVRCIKDLNIFLNMIGTSVRHLRNIKVIEPETNKAVSKATMSRLKHAKGLNKLQLPWEGKHDRVQRTAEILRVLFRHLHKARVQPTGTFPVLNIFRFHVDTPAPWYDLMYHKREQQIKARAYAEQCKWNAEKVKHELQKFLK